ncbi:MAG: hypothetical protein RQM95_11225 [Syntrophaceticus schinkii]
MTSLAEYLARRERTLSEVLAELPGFVTVRRDVDVDWNDKGKVLRHLAEESGEQKIETAEGIKVQHPEGGHSYSRMPMNRSAEYTVKPSTKKPPNP